MNNHKEKECIIRIVYCQKCFDGYKFKDFDVHLKEECKDNQIKF